MFDTKFGGDEYGNLKINGETDSEPVFTLKNISGWSRKGNNANLSIGGFEYAISDTPIENAEHIYVEVLLTPGSILRKFGTKELHHDGSITNIDGHPDQIEWRLGVGKVSALTRCTYEEDNFFDNKAIIQIERPSLFFEIDNDSNLSTYDIRSEVEKDARDLSLILSLCYRKVVSWYEIKFFIITHDKKQRIIRPLIRKKVYTRSYQEHEDELINHRELIGGGLQTLLENFRSSPMIESLRRSITFLSSSQSIQTVEIQYFLAIISLEAFCDGLIELNRCETRIPSGKWKKIEHTLRSSLDTLDEQEGMSIHIERVKKKLPELKGFATLEKILYCCRILEVDANDLWQKSGLEAGLDKALSLRNHLFHRAYYEDPYFLYANCIRIQVLAERLILKHLRWPDDKIWRWYNQKILGSII